MTAQFGDRLLFEGQWRTLFSNPLEPLFKAGFPRSYIIKEKPEFNRMRLSKEVCRMLHWLKPDGNLKDMSCRVAMLRMHRDGLIELPPLHLEMVTKATSALWNEYIERYHYLDYTP